MLYAEYPYPPQDESKPGQHNLTLGTIDAIVYLARHIRGCEEAMPDTICELLGMIAGSSYDEGAKKLLAAVKSNSAPSASKRLADWLGDVSANKAN